MIYLAKLFVSCLSLMRSYRSDLLLEILALRQQLLALQRRNPKGKARSFDHHFWVLLSKHWALKKQVIKFFQTKSVIGWQRGLFSEFRR